MFRRLFALAALSLAVLSTAGAGIAHAATDHDFVMTADFRGLYPNADLVVPVSVYNPQRYDLAVHAATAIVSDASPSCPASNVIAHTFSGDIVGAGPGLVALFAIGVVTAGAGLAIVVRRRRPIGTPA